MTSKQIIAAVGMALMAVPASATTNTVAAKSGKSAAADQEEENIASPTTESSGSRVTKQEYKTKAEWAKDRVDIDKLLKGE